MTTYDFRVTTCDENGRKSTRPFNLNAMNLADAVRRSIMAIQKENPQTEFKGLTYFMSATE
jgi:hypothetical protein